jgi:hypothetical protein
LDKAHPPVKLPTRRIGPDDAMTKSNFKLHPEIYFTISYVAALDTGIAGFFAVARRLNARMQSLTIALGPGGAWNASGK